jgi:signal transduction histidine kinase
MISALNRAIEAHATWTAQCATTANHVASVRLEIGSTGVIYWSRQAWRCEPERTSREQKYESTTMQRAAITSLSQMTALRRFGKNIGVFWQVIVYALVALSLMSAWADNTHFYATPRGWTALTLAVCYLFVFSFGTRWVSGNIGTHGSSSDCTDAYWKERMNTGRVLYPWRAVVLWAALVGLAVGMITLNSSFVWLMWIPYGMSFSLFPMPRGLLLIIPTALLMMAYSHEFPANLSMAELLKFAAYAVGLACYSAVVFMPIMLLRNRFQRERMYQQLEQSHRELEVAHQQLEQAAEHERELAVLRERGRLARDMHDTLGHSLALMTVKLEAAQRLRSVDPARADHEVAATQAIARDALTELRAAIDNLRTRTRAQERLSDALASATREIATRNRWRVTCNIAPDIEPIDDQTYEALLRTGIEALTNIERHAEARTVHLKLARQDANILLCIEDDGIGILTTNPPRRTEAAIAGAAHDRASTRSLAAGDDSEITSPSGHYGITGMRERTLGAGGVFMIGPNADNHGTRVEVRLPITCD